MVGERGEWGGGVELDGGLGIEWPGLLDSVVVAENPKTSSCAVVGTRSKKKKDVSPKWERAISIFHTRTYKIIHFFLNAIMKLKIATNCVMMTAVMLNAGTCFSLSTLRGG